MNKKYKFVVGVALMTAAIAYLIVAAVRTTSEYYLTVNEAQQRRTELAGQMVRVAGRVAPGNITWDAASLTLAFSIVQPPQATQTGVQKVAINDVAPASFRVIARGQPKPDMFAVGRDVIVEGRLGADGTIEARQVLTSCPSKYSPEKTS
ncbi:MAG TPA: cytochrome c maturation protein CcmE [Candidatus Binataceae bacterium]|jgi:cytochrome c-type biogenesis protein CcmE|nr:cytochrome c maturation protein CcmE [Candidatus Binataceae bacterium]